MWQSLQNGKATKEIHLETSASWVSCWGYAFNLKWFEINDTI